MSHIDVCPTGGPEHGPLLGLTAHPQWGFHCPNQAHDGRPRSHPLGEAPVSRRFFTTAEVQAAAIERREAHGQANGSAAAAQLLREVPAPPASRRRVVSDVPASLAR